MTTTVISEQKNVRLSLIENNSENFYSVSTLGRGNVWFTRSRFNVTKQGFEKALLLYYRFILCNVDVNIIIDIDNDMYKNL